MTDPAGAARTMDLVGSTRIADTAADVIRVGVSGLVYPARDVDTAHPDPITLDQPGHDDQGLLRWGSVSTLG